MDQIITLLTQTLVEVVTILVGALVIFIGTKVSTVLDKIRAKDDLGIIDIITDRAVEYAEVELEGAPGIEKRDFALQTAERLLKARGIEITDEEILAGIENGVNKLHEKKPHELKNMLENL